MTSSTGKFVQKINSDEMNKPKDMKLTRETSHLLEIFRVQHVVYWRAEGNDWLETLRQIVSLAAVNGWKVVRVDKGHDETVTGFVSSSMSGGRFCLLSS